MSTLHTHLDSERRADLAKDKAEHPRRALPVEEKDPVLRALSAAEAAFNHYAAHHLRQANQPGEDKHKRIQQAGENADLAQVMRQGILAHFAQSHAVPQGWQAVPCEPTREMLDRARENLVRDGEIDPMLKSIYSAMLGATPKLATQKPTERKLVAMAKVGHITFGKGVSERLVIDAAIRAAERHAEQEALTPEQLTQQEQDRRALWDMMNGPLDAAEKPASKSPDGCGCCGKRGIGKCGVKVTHIPTGFSESCHRHDLPSDNMSEASKTLDARLAGAAVTEESSTTGKGGAA